MRELPAALTDIIADVRVAGRLRCNKRRPVVSSSGVMQARMAIAKERHLFGDDEAPPRQSKALVRTPLLERLKYASSVELCCRRSHGHLRVCRACGSKVVLRRARICMRLCKDSKAAGRLQNVPRRKFVLQAIADGSSFKSFESNVTPSRFLCACETQGAQVIDTRSERWRFFRQSVLLLAAATRGFRRMVQSECFDRRS